MGKKLVDVEDLMVWAANELARKRPGQATRRPAFDVGREDREIVGKWDRPMGFPPVSPMFAAGFGQGGFGGGRGEAPHPDALLVEQAIERLRLTRLEVSPSIEATLVDGLGFAVDAAGLMRAALANVANLLLVHGRLANRPSLGGEPLVAEAVRLPNGKPGIWRRQVWAEPTFGDGRADSEREVETPCAAIRKNLYPTGAFCRLEWTPEPTGLVRERAQYASWRAGLAWLATELSDRLESRAALPPRAAFAPWSGEVDGEPTRDLFGAAADRVYGPDEAATLAAERRVGRRKPIGGGAVYGWRPDRSGSGAREA